jgi:hypothetical protein
MVILVAVITAATATLMAIASAAMAQAVVWAAAHQEVQLVAAAQVLSLAHLAKTFLTVKALTVTNLQKHV